MAQPTISSLLSLAALFLSIIYALSTLHSSELVELRLKLDAWKEIAVNRRESIKQRKQLVRYGIFIFKILVQETESGSLHSKLKAEIKKVFAALSFRKYSCLGSRGPGSLENGACIAANGRVTWMSL